MLDRLAGMFISQIYDTLNVINPEKIKVITHRIENGDHSSMLTKCNN